ncbi:MarR family transcriptional regulator [Sphaerisporangium rufum]|uniref:MarR family transcriptional regulator n=1 Tax=Sphaerisporangium rufum TaxID=1381558 RepID=A0A919RA69_9ACTN|nr:MarR family transcriptional regulator [Sphaerisporangium rufum]GII80152.1 MarR family transcriptional regulator [Sphaerisporangium rufum]
MASDAVGAELLVRLGEAGAVIKAMRRELPPGCPRSGVTLLAALDRRGDLRVGELAEILDVDQSVISRHVTELVVRGWVERMPNPRDGRSSYLRLTPQGRQVMRESTDRLGARLAAMLDDWTDEEIATLGRLLARLRTSFDAGRAPGDHAPRAPRAPAPPAPPVPSLP